MLSKIGWGAMESSVKIVLGDSIGNTGSVKGGVSYEKITVF